LTDGYKIIFIVKKWNSSI